MTTKRHLVVALCVAAALVFTVGGGIALADSDHGHDHEGGGGTSQGDMGHMDATVRNEFDYLAEMIPHHEEAIVAAKALAKGSRRQEMRDFAAAIIETQSAEVAQMKAWLEDWYPNRDSHVDYTPMMRDLSGLRGDALDRAFLEDMIPHHMMAVMMSQQLVSNDAAQHEVVVPFAQNIRDTQHAEIRLMSGWLGDWFGADSHHMGDGPGMQHGSHTGMNP